MGLIIHDSVCLSAAASLSSITSVEAFLNEGIRADIQSPATSVWQGLYDDSLLFFDDDFEIYSSQESIQTNQSKITRESLNEKIDMHKIACLFDAGLSLAICGDLMKLGKGIVIKDERLAGRLSTTAPSLWCPGFLQVGKYAITLASF